MGKDQASAEKIFSKQLSKPALFSPCDCRNLRSNPAPATTSIINPYKSTSDRHKILAHQTVSCVSTIEIFNVIQGWWGAVPQENLAEHYSRSYWEPLGLIKAWEEIEAGAVADPEAELTLREHAEFLAEHLFGMLRKSPETPDERISVIVEEFDPAREEQEHTPPPSPQLPSFEERLDARMPEVLEIWAASQTGHIISRLLVEDLLHYQWPLSTIHQRALTHAMRQAGWTLRRNATKRFWVKNA